MRDEDILGTSTFQDKQQCGGNYEERRTGVGWGQEKATGTPVRSSVAGRSLGLLATSSTFPTRESDEGGHPRRTPTLSLDALSLHTFLLSPSHPGQSQSRSRQASVVAHA